MNNEQFRKLMLASSAKSKGNDAGQASPERASGAGVASGSRHRAAAPMKPCVYMIMIKLITPLTML